MSELTEIQQTALEQLQQITAGEDPDREVAVLRSVNWNVEVTVFSIRYLSILIFTSTFGMVAALSDVPNTRKLLKSSMTMTRTNHRAQQRDPHDNLRHLAQSSK